MMELARRTLAGISIQLTPHGEEAYLNLPQDTGIASFASPRLSHPFASSFCHDLDFDAHV